MYTTPEDLTQGDVPSPRRRMPADRTRRHRPRHCAELAHHLASGGPEGRAVRPSSRSVRTVRRWVQDTGHRAADPAAMVPVRRAGHLGRPPSPAGGRDTSRSNRTRLEHRYAAGPLVGVVRAPSVRPTDLGIGELEWLLSPSARGGLRDGGRPGCSRRRVRPRRVPPSPLDHRSLRWSVAAGRDQAGDARRRPDPGSRRAP